MDHTREYRTPPTSKGHMSGYSQQQCPVSGQYSTTIVVYYTNDQSLPDETCNFIYANDLCVTYQHTSFNQIEAIVEEALSELTHHYRTNSLQANPDKTQVTSFIYIIGL